MAKQRNIKYSKPDATTEEMREAAKQANALHFIENSEFDSEGKKDAGAANELAQGTGFQRMVGPKGSQISGG